MTGQGRLGWYLVDGLPYWLVDKLLRLHRERFPALSRCFAENRIGAFQPLRPNCQTPASLAALFSGSNSAETWLSGFDQPDFSDPAMVRSKRAFGGLCGDVRLIWDWAAEAGMKVSLAHLPYVDRARLGSALASYAYGFGPAVVAPAVFDCQEATALFGRDQLATIAGDRWGSLWVYRPAERGQPDDRVRGLAKRCVIGGAEKLLFLGAWRVELAREGRALIEEWPGTSPAAMVRELGALIPDAVLDGGADPAALIKAAIEGQSHWRWRGYLGSLASGEWLEEV